MIAHSHWWSSDELTKRLPNYLGAFEKMPNEWGIDPVKLACIMRASDAAHIDTRRAPLLLKAFRQPNEYASQHWLFQQRLYQPRLESERLVYTSKSSFSPDEFNSWWLCFDTLKMIDKELRDVDSILGDTQRPRFKAKGVAAINNIHLLSRLIGTDGWFPVDTKIHVGNVAKLVKNLGGEQLYGKNLIVPLRELIQNACDAVRARRTIESEDSDWGKVTVRTGTDKSGHYIEVEDNGVGMSVNVLSGPFLDFGTSFWGSNMMHDEFPGLESKGFSSTGKFGVGFFSTFMWGEKVNVTTRRFEDSRQNTKVLMFENGLSDRPLLREAQDNEYIKDGGTRIKVYFSSKDTYSKIFGDPFGDKYELCQIIEELCPTLDVTIFTEDANINEKSIAVKANDWQLLSGMEFVQRALGPINFSKLHEEERNNLIGLSRNVKNIYDNGIIIGRGFLSNIERVKLERKRIPLEGAVTVGGFRTTSLKKIMGLFVGKETRASRDVGIPLAEGLKLKEWASEQANQLAEDGISAKKQIENSGYLRALGGDTSSLIIAKHKTGFINKIDFEQLIRSEHKEIVLIGDDGFNILERENGKIILKDNVFVVDAGIPGILQTRNDSHWFSWPERKSSRFHDYSVQGVLEEVFASIWNVSLDSVLNVSDISSDDVHYNRVIGEVDGVEIEDDFVDILRIPM